MKSKILNDAPERTYVLAFEHGDKVMETLAAFAEDNGLTASRITGLGAFEHATLGYFDWATKDYARIPIEDQVEVISLVGDIAVFEGKPKLHVHVVLGKRDGTACGGHLLEATVRPTLEIMLTDAPSHLRRTHDPESGLPLLDPQASR